MSEIFKTLLGPLESLGIKNGVKVLDELNSIYSVPFESVEEIKNRVPYTLKAIAFIFDKSEKEVLSTLENIVSGELKGNK